MRFLLIEGVQVAERLRSMIGAHKSAGLSVTMSFGVSGSSSGAFDFSAVLAAADRALYGAKAAGGNCVRVGSISTSDDHLPPDEEELVALAPRGSIPEPVGTSL